jgi:hypothetical protein
MDNGKFDKDLALKSLEKSLDEREFYSVGYQKSLAIMILTLISLMSAVTYAGYAFFIYQPPVSYLALNEDYKMLEEKPLNVAHTSKEEMMQWATDSVKDVLSWNHVSFKEHGMIVNKYFFQKEAPKFMKLFNELYLQEMVKFEKAVVVPDFISPFQLEKEGKYGSRKAFMLYSTILLKRIGKDGTKIEKYDVKVLVAREKFSVQKDGFSIVKLEIVTGDK